MNKKFIFIVGIVLFSSYSCKKNLLTPVSQTSVAAVGGAPFSTLARIQAQVLGLYTTIRSGQSYGGRYQIYNDVKAD
ncbi:MAG: RagB/SusD family nutrient uptake outer membrane protein, partial [Sphingobacteriaceae bacterium]